MKKQAIYETAETPPNGSSPRGSEVSSNRANGRHEVAGMPSVLVGRIAAISESSEPLVDFPGNISGELVPARSLVPITQTENGREVALTFEDGDGSRPIIVGILQLSQNKSAAHPEIKVDEETLVLNAQRQIVLQCGKSSITLTSAGKVLIRGAYLLSRSSGVNRIKGGSVQIN